MCCNPSDTAKKAWLAANSGKTRVNCWKKFSAEHNGGLRGGVTGHPVSSLTLDSGVPVTHPYSIWEPRGIHVMIGEKPGDKWVRCTASPKDLIVIGATNSGGYAEAVFTKVKLPKASYLQAVSVQFDCSRDIERLKADLATDMRAVKALEKQQPHKDAIAQANADVKATYAAYLTAQRMCSALQLKVSALAKKKMVIRGYEADLKYYAKRQKHGDAALKAATKKLAKMSTK